MLQKGWKQGTMYRGQPDKLACVGFVKGQV
jgi:hypothetical protein